MKDIPAFPSCGADGCGPTGMSLRDYFAAMVLSGQSALPDDRTFQKNLGLTVEEWRDQLRKSDAEYCYKMANAMLAEREKQP